MTVRSSSEMMMVEVRQVTSAKQTFREKGKTHLWKGIPMLDFSKGLQHEKHSSTESPTLVPLQNWVHRFSIYMKAENQFVSMFNYVKATVWISYYVV